MTLNAPTRRLVGAEATRAETLPLTARSAVRPHLRPCRASWLLPNGSIEDSRFLIPAHRLFEGAFCAFARGSLIETPNGPVAIEDLLPGDSVLTQDGRAEPVIWIGSTTLVPSPADDKREVPLFRVMPDAFGLGRPLSHMVVGPSARMLGVHQHGLRRIASFEDGENVSRLRPPSPVDMYHICLRDHAILRVGGLLCESYHPGHGALSDVGPAMRELFLKLFPQIDHIGDFGLLALPRDQDDLDEVDAA